MFFLILLLFLFINIFLALPGLSKHLQLIEFLILKNIPDLYEHFVKPMQLK